MIVSSLARAKQPGKMDQSEKLTLPETLKVGRNLLANGIDEI